MNLLRKAAEFEYFCIQFAKRAQQSANEPFRFNTPVPEASLSAPTPKFRVFKTPEEAKQEAIKTAPTVNVHDLPSAQPKNNKQLPLDMLNTFSNTLMNFDPDQFNGISVDEDALKAAGNKLNAAVINNQPANILKALSDVLGLTKNGGGQLYITAYKLYNAVKAAMPAKQPAQWLTQYMNEQKLMDQADEMKDQMQVSLNNGPTVTPNKIE